MTVEKIVFSRFSQQFRAALPAFTERPIDPISKIRYDQFNKIGGIPLCALSELSPSTTHFTTDINIIFSKQRSRTHADYCIVVLSGNFVQRGEPSVFEKTLRTEAALRCGADLVLELPSPFASGSAEDFACGAVALLSALGTIDYLCFGSEWEDERRLMDIARRTHSRA